MKPQTPERSTRDSRRDLPFEFDIPCWNAQSLDNWNPLLSMLKPVIDGKNPVWTGFTAWQDDLGRTTHAINREWLHFVHRRMKEDIGLGTSLARAKGPEHLVEIYSQFWQKAFDDYRVEFGRIARLSAESGMAGHEATGNGHAMTANGRGADISRH